MCSANSWDTKSEYACSRKAMNCATAEPTTPIGVVVDAESHSTRDQEGITTDGTQAQEA